MLDSLLTLLDLSVTEPGRGLASSIPKSSSGGGVGDVNEQSDRERAGYRLQVLRVLCSGFRPIG